MKKLAVCTVGVVLALLLGGLSSVDQIHSAVGTGASVVYAAQSATAPACLADIPISGVVSEKCTFKASCKPRIVISPGGEVTIEIECSIEIICDF
jgi:hypothetical protein